MLPITVKRAVILKLELVNTPVFTLNEQTVQIKKINSRLKTICDQPVSSNDFKVLASSNSEFHLKIKESLLISRDQPVLNKNEASLLLTTTT